MFSIWLCNPLTLLCDLYWVIATPWFFLLSMFYASLYWDHCPVAWPKWSFSSSSDCLAFGSRIVWCRGPVAAKPPTTNHQIIITKVLCLTEVFVPIRFVCFLPNIFVLVSSVQRTLIQTSCGFFRFSFASINSATMFFLERRGLQHFQTHTCSFFFKSYCHEL